MKAHNRAINLRRYYGITEEQYASLMEAQDGKCKICGSSGKTDSDFPLVIDHCHTSTRIRSLLCGTCNSGIGQLREDVTILRAAIAYLEQEPDSITLYANPGMPSGVRHAHRLRQSKSERQ